MREGFLFWKELSQRSCPFLKLSPPFFRHVTMVGEAPKIARWDYHSCHVNQLYTLASATRDTEIRDILLTVAERWRGYMIGNVASHN